MVLEVSPCKWKQLSYKERRRLINKEKKRRDRIAYARKRKAKEEEFDDYLKTAEGIEEQRLAAKERQKEEAEKLLKHEEWLERERKAQEEFREKKEREEKKLKDREERERMIREEWEEIEKREKEAEEKKTKAKHSKEALLEEALADIDQTLKSIDEEDKHEEEFMPWHNPFAPATVDQQHSSSLDRSNRVPPNVSTVPATDTTVLEDTGEGPMKTNYGTEKDKINCPFYLKTGACRYGDRCSRHHAIPSSSSTLLIRGMYNHTLLTQQFPDDQDAALEVDETDLTDDYHEFYQDVFPELADCGKIIQFKVSRNFEPHLRGNVYVQFSTVEQCTAAVKVFNGRWYAGKQLSCEYSPVERWRTAICGLYNRQQCPKGKHCNFLHVFENPGGAFGMDDTTDQSHDSEAGPEGVRGSKGGRYQRRHLSMRLSHDSRRRSPSPDYSSHRRRDSWTDRRRQSGNGRRRSYSPVYKRRSSPSDRRRRGNDDSPYYSRTRHRRNSNGGSDQDGQIHSRSRSPRRRKSSSQSPDKERRERKESGRMKRNVSRSSCSPSPPLKRSPSVERRHKRKRRSSLSHDNSPSSHDQTLSSSRTHKKKKKSRSKHGHSKKKHKRKRHDSNDSDSGDQGEDKEHLSDHGDDGHKMKEIMDQVLRKISVEGSTA